MLAVDLRLLLPLYGAPLTCPLLRLPHVVVPVVHLFRLRCSRVVCWTLVARRYVPACYVVGASFRCSHTHRYPNYDYTLLIYVTTHDSTVGRCCSRLHLHVVTLRCWTLPLLRHPIATVDPVVLRLFPVDGWCPFGCWLRVDCGCYRLLFGVVPDVVPFHTLPRPRLR